MKEGGGNNYYNNDILKIIDTDLINTSIIMERINPFEYETMILENGRIIKKNQTIKQVIHITRDSEHTNKEIINKITRGNIILSINE